jgi:hypothetical protein
MKMKGFPARIIFLRLAIQGVEPGITANEAFSAIILSITVFD